MHDIERDGIEAVLEAAFEILGSGPVFLTVEVDVLDPASPPVPGPPSPVA